MAENIFELAPKLSTYKEVDAQILARLVVAERIRQRGGYHQVNYDRICNEPLMTAEAVHALEMTGYQGTLADLGWDYTTHYPFRKRDDQKLVNKMVGKISERILDLQANPFLDDLEG